MKSEACRENTLSKAKIRVMLQQMRNAHHYQEDVRMESTQSLRGSMDKAANDLSLDR